MCTEDRVCVLHDPPVADIILDVWESLPARFPTIALGEFVVMPNHVHMIVWLQAHPDAIICQDVPASLIEQKGRDWAVPAPLKINLKPALGDVIAALKSLVFTVYLRWIDAHKVDRQAKFWQRNYFEHVVRDERELRAIRQYIVDNPEQWDMDRDNPNGHSGLPVPCHISHYLSDLKYTMERQ